MVMAASAPWNRRLENAQRASNAPTKATAFQGAAARPWDARPMTTVRKVYNARNGPMSAVCAWRFAVRTSIVPIEALAM